MSHVDIDKAHPTMLKLFKANYGLDLADIKDNFKFLLRLAMQLSYCTELLCQLPKGAILHLGEVCNMHRIARVEDLHSWIMLMQVWGAHSGNQPHLTLAESRYKAHTLLQQCHDKL